MSIMQSCVDGAWRAAQLLSLLFVLNQPQAAAQPVGAAVAIDADIRSQAFGDLPLTLLAQHHDIRVTDAGAVVRSLLTLRNDRPATVFAHYQLPQPAQVWRDPDASPPSGPLDLPARAAELLESGEVLDERAMLLRGDVLAVDAGESITLVVDRRLDVMRRGKTQRIELPLASDRDAPFVPRLSADVLVESATRVVRLQSPTHAALVDGVGQRLALLSIADGRVHRGAILAVQFELAPPAATATALRQADGERR